MGGFDPPMAISAFYGKRIQKRMPGAYGLGGASDRFPAKQTAEMQEPNGIHGMRGRVVTHHVFFDRSKRELGFFRKATRDAPPPKSGRHAQGIF